ncbi:MAG: hypothetical protein KA099_04445 [Alphaproteobacteria bacterium]|nr:hypothetical protein [Alphaproteobacteria bacterium]MBP7757732.1 hypothetical protein [Alphaproteobacteria bacterium]MBP7761068.1 hypothetical protein [Alphaproteobacteria bacterium]MBP7904558.1 hypothetical protein [Alphaproteobacteria bacterium]
MTIAGASQFRIQALAQLTGVPTYDAPNLFGSSGGSSAISLLDTGRQLNGISGLGLSGNARALNNGFIASRSTDINKLFSLTGGSDGTLEGNQAAILALRSSRPESQISKALRGQEVDTEA